MLCGADADAGCKTLGLRVHPKELISWLEPAVDASHLRAVSAQIPKDKLVRGAVGDHEGMSKLKFFTYMLVPLSVGMFPHVFQHWLTAKSASSFKLPVVAHPIFIMIVWLPCVLIGAWAASDRAKPSLSRRIRRGGPNLRDHHPTPGRQSQ